MKYEVEVTETLIKRMYNAHCFKQDNCFECEAFISCERSCFKKYKDEIFEKDLQRLINHFAYGRNIL